MVGKAYTASHIETSDVPLIVEEVEIDEVLSLDDVSVSLLKEISRLAPFGTGNPKPLFMFQARTPIPF